MRKILIVTLGLATALYGPNALGKPALTVEDCTRIYDGCMVNALKCVHNTVAQCGNRCLQKLRICGARTGGAGGANAVIGGTLARGGGNTHAVGVTSNGMSTMQGAAAGAAAAAISSTNGGAVTNSGTISTNSGAVTNSGGTNNGSAVTNTGVIISRRGGAAAGGSGLFSGPGAPRLRVQ